MSIGPLLSALDVPPQAVTPTPMATAPRAARLTRATARRPPCLPSARPKWRLTGLEKRVPIKFLPFLISLVYKRRGRVADCARGGWKIGPRGGTPRLDDAVGWLRPVEHREHVVRDQGGHRIARVRRGGADV